MPIKPYDSIKNIGKQLSQQQYSSLELANTYLERIQKFDKQLNAYTYVDPDSVIQQAKAADMRRVSGYLLGPLDGIPIAVKDMCDIAGQATTCGSLTMADNISNHTSTVVKRLQQAGMIILGKLNMVEFAFGGWGTNSQCGTPQNPWDLETHRVAGGSSSGSSVAVAAGLAPAAIGTDTGGSVRIPSSFVGITGLKTTRSVISRAHIKALSPTLDTVGPMTRSVEDAALLMQAIAGPDLLDPETLSRQLTDYSASSNKDLSGVHISLLEDEHYPDYIQADVARVFQESIGILRELGATVVTRKFPFRFEELVVRNGIIITAEAWQLYGHLAEDPNTPMDEVIRSRILKGAKISSAEYINALNHHKETRKKWQNWMQNSDALITPTVPVCAPPLSEIDEDSMIVATFTRGCNYMGACGLSLPAGFSANKLPIGVQLLAKPFDENTLLRIGSAFQLATNWHEYNPGF